MGLTPPPPLDNVKKNCTFLKGWLPLVHYGLKFYEQRLTFKLAHLLTCCSFIKPITNLMQAPRSGGSLLNSISPLSCKKSDALANKFHCWRRHLWSRFKKSLIFSKMLKKCFLSKNIEYILVYFSLLV